MSPYLIVLMLTLPVRSAFGLSAAYDTTGPTDSVKHEPQWGTSEMGRYPKVFFSGGGGFTTDVRQVPLIFPHWEGALGISGPLPFDLFYRGEISAGVDPFQYSGLTYISTVRMESVVLRFYPIKGLFFSVGYGSAQIGTDTIHYTTGPLNGTYLGPSSTHTPVISAGAGYCGGYFYAELRQNFGLRNIQLYDQKPISFQEFTIAAGVYFRVGPP